VGDIACPPPAAPVGSASVFSDHDVINNVLYHLPSTANAAANPEFLSTFTEIPSQVKSQVKHFPPEWLDYSAMPADHPTEFVTSDNCIGCHGGLSGTPNRPVMFVENGDGSADGFDLSEYDKAHPNKDPLLKGSLVDTQNAVTNTCLSCHGAMGQRQLAKLPAGIDPDSISVTATLYNQSIPPYWLKQRFEAAPDGEGTKRLHYLTSHLNLKGSAMENWKLRLVSDTETVKKGKKK